MLSLSTAALLAFALAKGAHAVTNETGHRTVEQVSAAWYAGWHSDDFPLSAVSWDKYTQLTYSFAFVFFCSKNYLLETNCALNQNNPA